MPNIRIMSVDGSTWSIDSSDPEVIKGWLLEQCEKVCTVNTTCQPTRMEIWPSYTYDHTRKAVADWQPGGNQISLTRYEESQAFFANLQKFLTNPEKFVEVKGTPRMSNASWCDVGQHAFPANQPGATTIKVEQQVRNQWGGYQPHDIVQDVCAACAKDTGIRKISDIKGDVTEEVLDAQAEAVRDGTYRQKFMKRAKAITNGETAPKGKRLVDDVEYQEYIAYLESKNAE